MVDGLAYQFDHNPRDLTGKNVNRSGMDAHRVSSVVGGESAPCQLCRLTQVKLR